MDKDQQLIYEAYLTESLSKKLVLAALCAAGLGCNVTKHGWEPANQPHVPQVDEKDPKLPRIKVPQDNITPLLQLLGDLLGPLISNLDDNNLHLLKKDLTDVLKATGGKEPEGGWEAWVKQWYQKNASRIS